MKKIILLLCIHVFIIVISNYLVQFPQNFMGIDYTWAMFSFPIAIFITDLTVRLIGADTAQKVVNLSYIPGIILSALITDWRIGIASGTAYFVGQKIYIFMIENIEKKQMKNWWISSAIARIITDITDTYIFYAIAFYNTSTYTDISDNWVEIANTDMIFKLGVSLLFFLPIYGMILKIVQNKIEQ